MRDDVPHIARCDAPAPGSHCAAAGPVLETLVKALQGLIAQLREAFAQPVDQSTPLAPLQWLGLTQTHQLLAHGLASAPAHLALRPCRQETGQQGGLPAVTPLHLGIAQADQVLTDMKGQLHGVLRDCWTAGWTIADAWWACISLLVYSSPPISRDQEH